MTRLFSRWPKLRLALGLLTLPFMVSACTTLPSQGPSAMDIALHQAETAPSPDRYVMVRLDANATTKISSYWPVTFPNGFTTALGGTRAVSIGIGDALVVNIWEASADGVFATTEKKQTSLQAVVDENGRIFIPYAGQVKAAGRTVESLRAAIEEALRGKAVEPQVQVLVADNRANSVVVVGDVAKPGQYPITVRGVRLLEAIAQAGGASKAIFETVATVTRGGRTGTVRLDEIVSYPKNNIWLASGDTVLIAHQPRTYSAFGAVKTSGLVPFKTENVSLAEALAQVGGLRDASADAGGVFVFRFEDVELARWLVQSGRGVGHYEGYAVRQVPVIYRVDFTDPQAFFLAQGFRMRDKDIVYVANHPTAELGKFLSTIVSPVLGTARTTVALAE